MKDAEQSSCYTASFPLSMPEIWQSVRFKRNGCLFVF